MNVDLKLKDKVAIVTGAGGGIGREIALALAAEGVSIIVNDIGVSLTGEGGSETPAQETSGLITQKGGKAVVSSESVSSWESAQLIIKKALDTFGKIDIVVNNAGILRDTIFPLQPRVWDIPGEGDENNPLSLESVFVFMPALDSSFVMQLFETFTDTSSSEDTTDILGDIFSELS